MGSRKCLFVRADCGVDGDELFWDFISSSKDQRIREKKKLLEDVFEAIIGATYYILDNNLFYLITHF